MANFADIFANIGAQMRKSVAPSLVGAQVAKSVAAPMVNVGAQVRQTIPPSPRMGVSTPMPASNTDFAPAAPQRSALLPTPAYTHTPVTAPKMEYKAGTNHYQQMYNPWGDAKNMWMGGALESKVNNLRSQYSGARDAAIQNAQRRSLMGGQGNLSPARQAQMEAQFMGQASNAETGLQADAYDKAARFEESRLLGTAAFNQARAAGMSEYDAREFAKKYQIEQGNFNNEITANEANMRGAMFAPEYESALLRNEGQEITNRGAKLELDAMPELIRQKVESGQISLGDARTRLNRLDYSLWQDQRDRNQGYDINAYNFDEYKTERPYRDRVNAGRLVDYEFDRAMRPSREVERIGDKISGGFADAAGFMKGSGMNPFPKSGKNGKFIPDNTADYHFRPEPLFTNDQYRLLGGRR